MERRGTDGPGHHGETGLSPDVARTEVRSDGAGCEDAAGAADGEAGAVPQTPPPRLNAGLRV